MIFSVRKITAFLMLTMASSGFVVKETCASSDSQIRFQAQKRVRSLSRKNIRRIDYIEFISKIYGYEGYEKLKKNYWTAKMEVVRGDIIKAKDMLEKNMADINKSMAAVFGKYSMRSRKVINDGVIMVSEMHIIAMDSKDYKVRKKYKENRDRINVAMEHAGLAEKAGKKERYKEAIKHYRNAKSIALDVIKRLSDEHADEVMEKYSLDIKDLETEYVDKDSY